MSVEEILTRDFATLPEVIHEQALERPDQDVLVDARRTLTYAGLDALMDRIAAALQRDGVSNRGVAAICATTSVEYGATFLGTPDAYRLSPLGMSFAGGESRD